MIDQCHKPGVGLCFLSLNEHDNCVPLPPLATYDCLLCIVCCHRNCTSISFPAVLYVNNVFLRKSIIHFISLHGPIKTHKKDTDIDGWWYRVLIFLTGWPLRAPVTGRWGPGPLWEKIELRCQPDRAPAPERSSRPMSIRLEEQLTQTDSTR